jgi:3-deoxy-manno-octulosonate cytidylyltransferase (CMP-KDO synthetase)
MPFHVIIPARLGATRLPGKPLLDIAGRPMIAHVCARALASGAASVSVATDDAGIAAAARAAGAAAVLTASRHRNGTERLAEAAATLGLPDAAVVVNVQGDEPLIEPAAIGQIAHLLQDQPAADVASLCHPVTDAATLHDPNTVKCVRDAAGFARYFSRAPLPWARDAFATAPACLPPGVPYWQRVGMYAYRVAALRRYVAWPPCAAETAESLEQLRFLHHGARIFLAPAERPPAYGSVDTPEDLAAVRALLASTAPDVQGQHGCHPVA